MFASAITDRVTLDDVVVTIQKLSGRQLREAAEAKADADEVRMARAAKAFREAGVALQEAIEDKPAAAGPRSEPPSIDWLRRARYRAYDRATVLHAGIKSWTAPEPVSRAAVEDLDAAAEEVLFIAILDLSLPPLEPGAAEGARKNA